MEDLLGKILETNQMLKVLSFKVGDFKFTYWEEFWLEIRVSNSVYIYVSNTFIKRILLYIKETWSGICGQTSLVRRRRELLFNWNKLYIISFTF